MSIPPQLTRRDFLTAACATCATCVAGPCLWADQRSRHLTYVGAEDAPPIEQFVMTVCRLCPGGCGLRVRVVHGCAVGVRGNTSHPVNRGGLCSRGSAVLQELYHPERLRRPRQRVGARGSGQWQEIEWEAAIGQIVEKLSAIRGRPGPHALLTLIGRDRGLTRLAWRRFMRAFGSPNLIPVSPAAALAGVPAIRATHGVEQRIGYDLPRAAYVMSFASQWLDAHWSAAQASRAYAEFRRSRPGLRPRWVHVEPRMSLTGAKANEWVPVRPGTEGALALAFAHVIVREGLYDREFVAEHCHGFEDWTDSQRHARLGFRRLVLQEYSPARVQEITGVPEGTIFRLAREFSRHRPAVAIGYDDGGCGTQRVYDRMAIHSLNALVGSIDVPGGVTVFGDMSLLDTQVSPDETARHGLAQPRLDGPITERHLGDSAVDRLPAAIGQSVPYGTEAVFLVGANPVFDSPEGAGFVEALLRVPLVVGFADFADDSNRYADLILPGLHGLERWDLDLTHTLSGHPVFSVSQPVVEPPPGLRHPYDVLRAIAQGLGESVAAGLPWESAADAVQAAARELFEGGRGAAFGPAHEESWTQLLESRGWRAPFAETFDAFWEDLLKGGGWTDPIYFHEEWDRVLKAPARRFAFHSELLRQSLADTPPAAGEQGDVRFLPHHEPLPADPSRRFPLQLYVYSLPALAHMENAHLPWLNDISGAYMLQKWDSWVEIHPETAKRYGIHAGDRVAVSTSRGRLELRAKIFAGVMPGVLAVPFGFGHECAGRWAAREGGNPARIVTPLQDRLSGVPFWNGTHAAVSKV